jgi:F-type H+-transporting ATPase subunit O
MFAGRVAARTARVAAPRFQVSATRSFAEAAAKPAAANTRPPIDVFGVDGTYASALVCAHEPADGRRKVQR